MRARHAVALAFAAAHRRVALRIGAICAAAQLDPTFCEPRTANREAVPPPRRTRSRCVPGASKRRGDATYITSIVYLANLRYSASRSAQTNWTNVQWHY